jgi:hypothetical protein
MKFIALILILLFCVGCSQWVAEKRPETQEERLAVAKHEAEILSKIPQTLSGHDQDWDDVIAEVHKISVDTYCKTRLYEWKQHFTGKMREVEG